MQVLKISTSIILCIIMIPLTLQIKNFLSYGEPTQTIDFGAYGLLCLSGKNGHGKSALLDAITWAVWGQARKIGGTAKADQGLLRLGQTQMMVCFDFECSGNRYRIRREYMQTYGKPVAILDFGMLAEGGNSYIPLTEKTIRDTQAKIEQTLHLTFDGFINSAFLRQGQANEFSKKSPKERKEVLAGILGLDRYEVIRRLAAEKVKHSQNQIQYLAALIAKLEQELCQEATLAQRTQAVAAQEKELIAHEENLATGLAALEKEKATVESAKNSRALLAYQQTQLINKQQALSAQFTTEVATWRSIHRQQIHTIDYTALEHTKQQLIATHALQQKELQNQLGLQQTLLMHKEKLNTVTQAFQEQTSAKITAQKMAIERLALQAAHHTTTLTDTLIRTHKIETALKEVVTEQAQLATQITEAIALEPLQNQFEKRKEHYHHWIAQANMMSAQLNATGKKNMLVIDEESPSCPLCEQNLSAARRRFLKKQFEEDAATLMHRVTRLSNLIKTLKPMLMEQHTQLEQLKKQEQAQALARQSIEQLRKKQQLLELEQVELQQAAQKLQELHAITGQTIAQEEKALALMVGSLANELNALPAYQEIAQEIARLEKERASQKYDKALHDQTIAQLQEVEQKLAQHQELQQQTLLQAQRAAIIAQLADELRALKKEAHAINTQLQALAYLDEQEKILARKKYTLEGELATFAQRKEILTHEKGALQTSYTQLEALKQEHARYQKERVACTTIIEDYQAIAQATGKDGIQALLIEDAIPEIEHEANELLAKLTENQTQLFIESLRDLKKGGTKETLDIKISDAAGIRPYELFSGGEAFRIDFALRIAISKLLARRSGTSLKTLIIDEGFGSQDEEGLGHIMDALYKIQEDFAKIIIVSHLSSMKNQFPVHFVVEKGPQGSMVHVMEQG